MQIRIGSHLDQTQSEIQQKPWKSDKQNLSNIQIILNSTNKHKKIWLIWWKKCKVMQIQYEKLLGFFQTLNPKPKVVLKKLFFLDQVFFIKFGLKIDESKSLFFARARSRSKNELPFSFFIDAQTRSLTG